MINIHTLYISLILGIVEGLTEFLPISSTGHLIIVGNLLSFSDNKSKTFEIIIQLGSSLAVIIFFWKKVFYRTNTEISKYLCQKTNDIKFFSKKRSNFFKKIILATLPTTVLGFFLYEKITIFFEQKNIIYPVIMGSLLLLICEFLKPKVPLITDIDDVTYFHALYIGVFQCLALWPGFSRSGSTISCGLLISLSRKVASEFSFILSVPMIIGASVLNLYKNQSFLTLQNLPMLFIGFFSAFIVSFYTIKFFLQVIVNRISFIPFVIYRFILAFIIYIYNF